MKKAIVILAILAVLISVVPAFSQECHVGVAWTPDPATSAITEQKVYHDTDGVDGGDTLVGTVGPTAQVHSWIVPAACYAYDRVYVTTVYIGGLTVVSPKVAVQSVVGAILTNSVKHQQ